MTAVKFTRSDLERKYEYLASDEIKVAVIAKDWKDADEKFEEFMKKLWKEGWEFE